MLIDHFTQLQGMPQYAKSKHYVYIEAVANFDSVHQKSVLLEGYFKPNVKCVRRDRSSLNRYGVYTGKAEKNIYNLAMKNLLAQNRVYWANVFTTLDNKTRDMKERFYKELEQIRLEAIEEKVEGSTVEGAKLYITGKGGGGARKDDLWAAFCIAHCNAELTLTQEGFENLSAR